MPNYEGFKVQKFKGVITEIQDMTLRNYLATPEKIEAFKKGMTQFPSHIDTERKKETFKEARLDSTVTSVKYSVEYTDNLTGEIKKVDTSEFFNIPTILGWGRSKVGKVREINNLDYDTSRWLNASVDVFINKQGYLRLLPNDESEQ